MMTLKLLPRFGKLILTVMVFNICLCSYATDKFEEESNLKLMDDAHQYLSTKVVESAKNIDAFFGRFVRTDDENKSRIIIEQNFKVIKGDIEQNQDVEFRFNLPHLEKLLKFNFKKSGSKNLSKSTNQNTDNSTKEASTHILSWSTTTQASVVFSSKPDVSILFNKKLEFKDKISIYRLINEVFWFGRSGVGDRVYLEYDRQLSSRLLFRFANLGLWNEVGSITYSHGPELYLSLENNQTFLLFFKVNGEKVFDCAWCINNYTVKLEYARRVFRDWLLFKAGPRIVYPKDDNFKSTKSFDLSISLFLGSY